MAPAGHLGLGGAAGLRAPLRRAWRWLGCGVGGRGGEVSELEGGEEGRFGGGAPPGFLPRRRAQNRVGGTFLVYPRVLWEKVADPVFFSPPRENGGVCTPQSFDWAAVRRLGAPGSVPPPRPEPSSGTLAGPDLHLGPPAPSLTLLAAVVPQVGVHGREDPHLDLFSSVLPARNGPVSTCMAARFARAHHDLAYLREPVYPDVLRPAGASSYCPERCPWAPSSRPNGVDFPRSREPRLPFCPFCLLPDLRACRYGTGRRCCEGRARWFAVAAVCARVMWEWRCPPSCSRSRSRPSCATLFSRVDGAWREPRATARPA